jgi:hypothetical protein
MSITASNVSEHLHSYFDRDLVLSLGRTLQVQLMLPAVPNVKIKYIILWWNLFFVG